MANHPSAIKRHRQSARRRTANRAARARIQTLTRQVREAVAAGNIEQARERLHAVSKAMAKAASQGLLHPSSAARRTSRLARHVAAVNT